ncbi:hypothetical protein GCM10027597_19050 [Saccharopolyspora tripterygii]
MPGVGEQGERPRDDRRNYLNDEECGREPQRDPQLGQIPRASADGCCSVPVPAAHRAPSPLRN